MTLQQIKDAISEGKKVFWSNTSYEVVKSGKDYLIAHTGGHCIGLTWADGTTMNGKEKDFFTTENKNW